MSVLPQVSWTQALRTIVKNCYKQHGREDLLYAFEDQQVTTATTTQHHLTTAQSIAHLVPSQTVVQTINNPDGTVSLIQVHFIHCMAFILLSGSFCPSCCFLQSLMHLVEMYCFQVGTGHTVATLADASELPGVTVAQVNYSTVTEGEVTPTCVQTCLEIVLLSKTILKHIKLFTAHIAS